VKPVPKLITTSLSLDKAYSTINIFFSIKSIHIKINRKKKKATKKSFYPSKEEKFHHLYAYTLLYLISYLKHKGRKK